MEDNRLHDLPLDFARSASWSLDRVGGDDVAKASLEKVVCAFATVLSKHTRSQVVVVGIKTNFGARADTTSLTVAVIESPPSIEKAKIAIENASRYARKPEDEDPSFHPICQSAVTTFSTSADEASAGNAPLDLELLLVEQRLSLVYRSDLLLKRSAERLYAQTLNLVLSKVDVDSRDDLKMLAEVNSTKTPWPETSCIHDLFLEQNSNATAMLYDLDRTQTTYRGLATACRSLAQELARRNVGPDECVVLLVEREPSLYVAIFGVLLAGGCYVPLEPDYPESRILGVYEDCGAEFAITQTRFRDKFLRHFPLVMCDNAPYPYADSAETLTPTSMRNSETKPEHLVYVFYTSGTTGKPKGVMVEHRGLVRRMAWFQRRYPLKENESMLVKTTYTFGISEFETFWPLSAGACLLVANAEGHRIPSYIADLSRYATAFCFVPSALAAVAQVAAEDYEPADFAVKYAISCGEPLSAATAASFFEAFDGHVLSNVYGPTEADMTYFEIRSLEQARALNRAPPIGVPMDNVVVYLLDESGKKTVPCGAPGHLHFGAPWPARGYLGLESDAWIDNPFLTSERDDNFSDRVPKCAKLYATGDLARWLPSGQLAFCGRVNAGQIKLRGYRIELDEVAAACATHPQVTRSTALLVDADGPRARLVAYVVTSSKKDEDDDVVVVLDDSGIAAEALELAKGILPSYAAPSTVVELNRLPTTARGKLDRSKLPVPAFFAANAEDFVETATPTERAIEKIWQSILGFDSSTPLSASADFVELGGNSLLAGRATSMIRHELKASISGTAMYSYSTIAELAAFIDSQGSNTAEEEHRVKALKAREEKEAVQGYYKGYSSTAFFAVLGQLTVAFFALFCSDVLSAPLNTVCLVYAYRSRGAFYAASVVTPALSIVVPSVLGTLAVVLNRLVAPHAKQVPLWSRRYLGWLAAKHATEIGARAVESLFGGTNIHALFFRLCGARVAEGVVLESGSEINDPTWLSFGVDARVGRHCHVCAHYVQDGQLCFSSTTLRQNSKMQPRSTLGAGATLPANKTLPALSSAGGGAPVSADDLFDVASSSKNANFRRLRRQDYGLQLVFGVPCILVCEGTATFASLCVVQVVADLIFSGSEWSDMTRSLTPSVLARLAVLAWLFRLVEAEIFFAVCVFVKKTIIGAFAEGEEAGESSFRRWLWDRLVHHSSFEAATEPYVNTELLACKFRLLGCKIGKRVNMDCFDCVEHDLVEIGDEVVFGSSVVMAPDDGSGALRTIRILRCANVLDHSVLLAGATVEENAVTGSCTLGPRGHTFRAGTVSTGCVRGAPIELKFQGDVEAGTSRLRTEDKDRILEALRRHRDPVTFYSFNVFCVAAAGLLEPLDVVRGLAPVAAFFCYDHSPSAFLAVFVASEALAVTLVIAAKYAIVGTFEEVDTEYYGDRHLRWVLFMSCLSSVDNCLDAAQGTFLAPLFFRSMGSKIGNDCLLFYGAAIEFDLLSLGDFASTGDGCDLTCHTVENMVVKFAPVSIGDGCHMGANSICMPGGAMHKRSTLLQGSQVLKGEIVGKYEVWRGLPAARVSDDAQADRESLEANVDDEYAWHLAAVLGVGPVEAIGLIKAAESGEPRAKRVVAQLARLREGVGSSSKREKVKPIPPIEFRPPHLRPRKLSKVLDITIEEARTLVKRWCRGEPEAEALVNKARLNLFNTFARLSDDGGDNSRAIAIFDAAASGDGDAENMIRAYRRSAFPASDGIPRKDITNRQFASMAPNRPPFDDIIHLRKQQPGRGRGRQQTGRGRDRQGGFEPPPFPPPPPGKGRIRQDESSFYRDATIFLSGALVVSLAINAHFLLN